MKKVFTILFSLCYLLSVTACGRQKEGSEEPNTAVDVQECCQRNTSKGLLMFATDVMADKN